MITINYLEPETPDSANGRTMQNPSEVMGKLTSGHTRGSMWVESFTNKREIEFFQSCREVKDNLIIYNWAKKIKL